MELDIFFYLQYYINTVYEIIKFWAANRLFVSIPCQSTWGFSLLSLPQVEIKSKHEIDE